MVIAPAAFFIDESSYFMKYFSSLVACGFASANRTRTLRTSQAMVRNLGFNRG